MATIVYVNEFPDHDGDKTTGKKYTVVFRPEKACLGYVLLVLGAFVSIATMDLVGPIP